VVPPQVGAPADRLPREPQLLISLPDFDDQIMNRRRSGIGDPVGHGLAIEHIALFAGQRYLYYVRQYRFRCTGSEHIGHAGGVPSHRPVSAKEHLSKAAEARHNTSDYGDAVADGAL
jgi:hypothetical protein